MSEAPDYRALCDAMGWPPIAGGSPELDGALDQDKPDNAPEAPDTGQATTSEELSLDNFDPTQIPEEYREHVEAAYKQLRGDYTRKTQSLAQERQEIEQNTLAQWAEAVQQNPSLLKQLDLDERRLLEEYGYAPEQDEEDEFFDPTEKQLTELQQWKDSIEQEQQANARYEAEADFVEEQLDQLEKQSDREFDEEEATWIFDMARARPTKNGVPDVKGAVSLLDKVGKRSVESFKAAKTNTPRVPGQGKAGSKAVDPRNKEEFMDYLTQVAQEAEASQA
jgi:hypothetical protein